MKCLPMEAVPDHAFSPFYKELYAAVDDPSLDSIISWSKSNKSFIIWNPTEFRSRVLFNCPRMLCSNLKKIFEDLKIYGFKRVKESEHLLEFGHKKYFVRGQPELMKRMQAMAFMKRHPKLFEKQLKFFKDVKTREKLAGSFKNLTL